MRALALPRLLIVLALLPTVALGADETRRDGSRLPGAERESQAREGSEQPAREIRDLAEPLSDGQVPDPAAQPAERSDEPASIEAPTPAAADGAEIAGDETHAESRDAARAESAKKGARPATGAKVDFDGRGNPPTELMDITFNRKLQEPPRDQVNPYADRKPAKKEKGEGRLKRMTNPIRDGLRNSNIYKAIRLLGSRSKEWYWSNRFQEGTRVRVLMGNRTVFISQIDSAKTKKINDLGKKDLEGTGLFTPQSLSRSSISTLRQRLKAKLAEYGDRVTGSSLVRLMRFVPFSQAKEMEVNRRREAAAKVGPRKTVAVPDSLKSMNTVLPKLVLLDLRLFEKGVPLGMVDDMGKLLKAGVHFALITDKPGRGPGSIQEQLGWGLGDEDHDQHDKLVRYKLSVLADGGNTLMAYKGNYLENLPSARFGQMDLELLGLAAHKVGRVEIEARQGDRMVINLPDDADPTKFVETYEEDLAMVGIQRYNLELAFTGGKTQLIVRPSNLGEGLSRLYTGLQDHNGLTVGKGDVFVISKDAEVMELTKGSIQASAHMPNLGPEELAETALAAMLERYRVMGPADLAASASMIKGVAQDKEKYFNKTSEEETVEILIGHVIHSSLEEGIEAKRATGTILPLDEILAKADARWERSYAAEERNLLRNPSDSIADAKMRMIATLTMMYKNVDELLQKYPIVLGTETPHLTILQRYGKGGVPLYRNILRSTFDAMLARETPEGLDVLYLDLKTGKTHDLNEVGKDFQYQLYDFIAQRTKELPVPYNVEGTLRRVARATVGFLYPQRLVVPDMTEDARTKFEVDTLPKSFDKLRKAFDMEIPKAPAEPK